MAHKIVADLFASKRVPGWHRIGHVFNEDLSATEAAALCGADRVVIGTFPMGATLPNGEFMPMSDRRVIVRYPIEGLSMKEDDQDPAFRSLNTKTINSFTRLGECSPDYSIIQNEALVKALDKAGLTHKWKTETIGVLSEGAGIFICLDMGQDTIRGEEHKKYCLISDTRDGKSSLLIQSCWTRVVCANTLAMALGEQDSGLKIAIDHGKALHGDFEFTMDLLTMVEDQSTYIKQRLEALADIQVTADDLPGLLAATYPMPKRGGLLKQYDRVDNPDRIAPAQLTRLQRLSENHDYQTQQTGVIRQVAADRYDVLCRDYPIMKDNGLGYFNAVCEVADHTRNRGTTMSAIDGYKAEEKGRSYKALVALK